MSVYIGDARYGGRMPEAPAPLLLAHDVRGTGPLVVLLHGLTERREAWDPVSAFLADRFEVLRMDLRGHGASPVRGPYDLPTLVADVHATLQHVRPDAVPLVVGHSMGAVVATAYGVMHPTTGVVNVDQPLALGDMQARLLPVASKLRNPLIFPLAMRIPRKFTRGTLPDAELRRLARLRRARRPVVLGMWAPMLEQTPEELAETVAGITAYPDETPYLVVAGHDSGEEYVAWLRSGIPRAVYEVWKPTHYPHLAEPQRFADRIAAFAADGR